MGLKGFGGGGGMEGGAVHASYFDIEPCMEEEKKRDQTVH